MSRTNRSGLSLVEVLIVIAIIVIGIGLMLPATRRVHVDAARVQCTNNLKQTTLGLQDYHDTYQKLPPGCVGPLASAEDRLSWMVAILPYIEQDALYRQFDQEKGYNDNLTPAATSIKPLYCPSGLAAKTGKPLTDYIGMAGLGLDAPSRGEDEPDIGVVGYDRVMTFANITDGSSNTIAVMESHTDVGPWARGGASTVRGYDPAFSWQPSDQPIEGHRGFLVGMADGSVRSLSNSIEPQKLAAAVTIAGGEDVDLE